MAAEAEATWVEVAPVGVCGSIFTATFWRPTLEDPRRLLAIGLEFATTTTAAALGAGATFRLFRLRLLFEEV